MKNKKKKSIIDSMKQYKLEDGTIFYADNDKAAQKYRDHLKGRCCND